jgi:hypothetical protein
MEQLGSQLPEEPPFLCSAVAVHDHRYVPGMR